MNVLNFPTKTIDFGLADSNAVFPVSERSIQIIGREQGCTLPVNSHKAIINLLRKTAEVTKGGVGGIRVGEEDADLANEAPNLIQTKNSGKAAEDFNGVTGFTARISDVKPFDPDSELINSEPISVTINVTPVNDPPESVTPGVGPTIGRDIDEDVQQVFSIDSDA